MSLPTESSLTGYQYSGGIYGKTNQKNDKILLNIKGNTQSNNEDKSIQFNETEANLQLKDIYNNKNIHKSLKQRSNPNQILYYDKIYNNQYPVSDNLRNQSNLNNKYLKPIDNLNNNAINEINILQNNNQQYNTIQVNTESTLRDYNGNGDSNNNTFQNNIKIFEIKSKKKCNCNTKCFIKTIKITGLVLLIMLIIPLCILCFLISIYGSGRNSGNGGGSSGSNEVFSKPHSGGSGGICCCCCCFCDWIIKLIRKIRDIYNS